MLTDGGRGSPAAGHHIAVVTGGRDHVPTAVQRERFDDAIRTWQIDVVRCGGAAGVDTAIYDRLADDERELWRADWDRHGASAGPLRNRDMLDGTTHAVRAEDLLRIRTVGRKAILLVAFTGGTGTADCICAALERTGIVIITVERSPTEILVRITSPDFVAGAVIDGERIIRCAPILASKLRCARLHGRAGLRALVRQHCWRAEVVGYRPGQ